MDVHSSFYLGESFATVIWWLLIRRATGQFPHALCGGSVFVRPSRPPAQNRIPLGLGYKSARARVRVSVRVCATQNEMTPQKNEKKRWAPVRLVPWLVARRQLVFSAAPLALGVAAVSPSLPARLAVACCYTLYHLLETAFSSRHGEYAVLYATWAMVQPSVPRQAAS